MSYTTPEGDLKVGKVVFHVVALLVLLTVIFGSTGTISAGERGIKTRFGKVVGTVETGLYFKTPYIESVNVIDVQTQKEQVNDANTASADLQTVTTNIAVNYNVAPDKIVELYTKVGVDYKSKIIDPAIQETLKAVTAKYTAEQLITKRDTVTSDIKDLLSTKLSVSDIAVTSISITNFNFSPKFNEAIESKVTAEQNALAAKNKLDQVKYEAEQTVASAKAQAEAIQIQAQAINSQGGADYVKLKQIEKWSGVGCTSYCGLETSNGLLINSK